MWYNYYTYSWSPLGSFYQFNTPIVVYIDTFSRQIVVDVISPHGCKGSDSIMVTVFPGNFLSPMQDVNFCPGDSMRIAASGASSYQWFPSVYLSDSLINNPMVRPVTTTTYSVIGTSPFGCRDTVGFKAIVHPAAVIFLPDSVRLYAGETYSFEPQTNCTTFNWFPSYGLNDATISNPVTSTNIDLIYNVTASTEWGCMITDSVAVYVSTNTLIDLPNAFTPGKGLNNEFKVLLRGVATLDYFRVYNRWGQLLFETTDLTHGWDGTFNGAPQPFDVYVYIIEARAQDGTVFTKQGNVTLVR
jgi:gliding motility-associated-like protein